MRKGQRYRYAEKLSRGGPGLAGAKTDRYHVWNDDWTAGDQGSGAGTRRARAARAERSRPASISCSTKASRRRFNGINGISQKGAQRRQRLALLLADADADERHDHDRRRARSTVTGESWMDHEFGTSFLEPEQRGWDWLSIQLSDNRELMLYQLRRADGSRDPRSSGTLVDADGKTDASRQRRLHADAGHGDVQVEERRRLSDRVDAVDSVAARSSCSVTTPLNDQELSLVQSTGIAYWEGMIDVTGQSGGQAVTGSGYLEMTGYHGSLGRVLSGQQ